MKNERTERTGKILMGVYNSSWMTSTITLAVVALLEISMLIYSAIDLPLFGPLLWKYRAFYITLLTLAVVYLFLNVYVKNDIEHRYKILSVANPVYSALFFAWSLGITWFDLQNTGNVDPIVFMTFSLVIPLGFYLLPSLYILISGTADILMVILVLMHPGYVGVLINLSIFVIFQFILGIIYLRLKANLTERILEAQKNAEIDVLTGLPNRRSYMEEMQRFPEEPDQVYITIDMNELKQVNDTYGHQAGDRLIVGAAECIRQCFGTGRVYRVGGDEFVVLISAKEDELKKRFADFEASMKSWSEQNGMTLSTSYGYVRCSEFPDSRVTELVKTADDRMYEAKAQYYLTNGKDRRRFISVVASEELNSPVPGGL